MENYKKYQKQFYNPPVCEMKWATKTAIDKAPIWCSVDLRDGNQALVTPMTLDEKLEFFQLLVKIGFKEIEVGFPSASETEFQFVRTLIEQRLIPDDVTIQVLTQSREHIIRRTYEALRGVKNAIVHLYNPISYAQREMVFRKTREEIKEIALSGARLFNQIEAETGVCYRHEYSPESFTGAEPTYALEVCNEILTIWKPTPARKVIIDLPATVELSMPHVYANQVEYICDNLTNRENVIVSLHPHNDRGSAVAASEMGLLAGADRLEGTLFGNGERTGNADVLTVAMNLYSQGIDPGLDFSHIPEITEVYERVTKMAVPERSPYCGKLVFAAFSGSHQDAIAKGMGWREKNGREQWTVPYLPIDPTDVGREYQTDVIRINSQSGKGGIGYLLEQNFGINLPKKMREVVGYAVKEVSDIKCTELSPEEVLRAFREEFVNKNVPVELEDFHYIRGKTMQVIMKVKRGGEELEIRGEGNGRLDAVSNAIRQQLHIPFGDLTYEEHAMTTGSASKAACYVSIQLADGTVSWGCGIDDDIIAASVAALFSAVNRHLLQQQNEMQSAGLQK